MLVPVAVTVIFPGTVVTIYPVIELPPSLVGAVKLTVACPSPATAVTFVGAPGASSSARLQVLLAITTSSVNNKSVPSLS